MSAKTMLILLGIGAVVIYFVSKNQSTSGTAGKPPVATQDFGAMGAFDFGQG